MNPFATGHLYWIEPQRNPVYLFFFLKQSWSRRVLEYKWLHYCLNFKNHVSWLIRRYVNILLNVEKYKEVRVNHFRENMAFCQYTESLHPVSIQYDIVSLLPQKSKKRMPSASTIAISPVPRLGKRDVAMTRWRCRCTVTALSVIETWRFRSPFPVTAKLRRA